MPAPIPSGYSSSSSSCRSFGTQLAHNPIAGSPKSKPSAARPKARPTVSASTRLFDAFNHPLANSLGLHLLSPDSIIDYSRPELKAVVMGALPVLRYLKRNVDLHDLSEQARVFYGGINHIMERLHTIPTEWYDLCMDEDIYPSDATSLIKVIPPARTKVYLGPGDHRPLDKTFANYDQSDPTPAQIQGFLNNLPAIPPSHMVEEREELTELEDSEVEPEAPVAPRARSASWPENFRVLEGEEDVRMKVDAPEAPEGPEGPDKKTAASRAASQVGVRTITTLTFKPDPEPIPPPPPPPTPSPVPKAPVWVKRESEEQALQTLMLQLGAPARFHEEGGVFVLDNLEKPEASRAEV
ncbi:hypothetical protein DFH07DRAFT_966540 [Mycena maculata]|uniref:Uncharacterized protein n=1 Tax=Mycena maculata TaxID=230809 RepID=A0AAD7I847_9AGAR|nr:hypothetical protein DFH07DRAFT_966540 [Mycena maculata]